MKALYFLVVSEVVLFSYCANINADQSDMSGPNIISRSEWKAKAPKSPPKLIPAKYMPVPYAIIHHSASNTNCSDLDCADIVRNIQKYHQDVKGWDDIGYNFLVAHTGNVYEGRGWGIIGAQAPNYNDKSMGICFIGNFDQVAPTTAALSAAQSLLQLGTTNEQIASKYILLGHRQVRATDCPGTKLYSTIQKWPNWKPNP